MNSDQFHISNMISSMLLNNDDINNFYKNSSNWSSCGGYVLSNLIAKYSLASDLYYVTECAYTFLKDNNLIDNTGRVLRGSKRRKKSEISWEHAIPSCVIRDYLLNNMSSISKSDIENVLSLSDYVVAVCKEDNCILNENGYMASMPGDWKLFEDSWSARYTESGIKILDFTIPMYGVVCR